jgi:hypothetical protein
MTLWPATVLNSRANAPIVTPFQPTGVRLLGIYFLWGTSESTGRLQSFFDQ